jgi:hypothetical protein
MPSPSGNRTYDKYLFEKEYKVPQRYATPISTTSTKSFASKTQLVEKQSNSLSLGTLVGAIVGSVFGGIIVGVVTFYFVTFMRHRRRMNKTGDTQAGPRKDKRTDKMMDERAVPGEVSVQPTAELGERQGLARETWVDPVELPDWALLCEGKYRYLESLSDRFSSYALIVL